MPYFDEPIGRIKIQTTSIDITECRLKSSDVKRHTVKDRGTFFFVCNLSEEGKLTHPNFLSSCRQYRLERELKSLLWKVDYNEICFEKKRNSISSFGSCVVGVNDIIQLHLFSMLKLVKCLRMSMFIYLAPSIFQAVSQLVTHSFPQSFSQSVSQSVGQSVSQIVRQSDSQSVICLDEGLTLEMSD